MQQDGRIAEIQIPDVEKWEVVDFKANHNLKFTLNKSPDGLMVGGVIYYVEPRMANDLNEYRPFVKYWRPADDSNFKNGYTALLLDIGAWVVGDRGKYLRIYKAAEGLLFCLDGKNSPASRFIRQ